MPSSSNISWGKSASNLLRDVAGITLSVTAVVACVYAIGAVTGIHNTNQQIWDGTKAFVRDLGNIALNAGDRVLNFFDADNINQLMTKLGNVGHRLWQHEAVKYIVTGTLAALGLYTTAKIIDSGSSPSRPAVRQPAQPVASHERQPGPNEMKLLAQRLKAAQANERQL